LQQLKFPDRLDPGRDHGWLYAKRRTITRGFRIGRINRVAGVLVTHDGDLLTLVQHLDASDIRRDIDPQFRLVGRDRYCGN